MGVPIAVAGNWPASKAFTALPATQALSFSGTLGVGGTTIDYYKAVLVNRPAGSAAALTSGSVQAPTLNAIDSEGTCLIFLQVADDRFNPALLPDPWLHVDNAGYVSEANPIRAPDSAFVGVSVRTEHGDFEIPAQGQRNWLAKYRQLVAALEALISSNATHTIASHDTGATGAELDTLTDGSDASALHTHASITTKATTSTHGIVRLASAPADAGNPKAVTKLLMPCLLTLTTAAAKLIADGSEVFVFRSPFACILSSVHLVAADGWDGTFDVFVRNEGQYISGLFGTSLGVISLGTIAARESDVLSLLTQSLNAGDYIIVARKVTTATPASPTKTLTCSLELSVQY